MTERQVKAYYRLWEDYTAEEVKTKFDDISNDPLVKTEINEDGQKTYAIRMPKMVWDMRGVSMKRARQSTDAPSGPDDEESMIKRSRHVLGQ